MNRYSISRKGTSVSHNKKKGNNNNNNNNNNNSNSIGVNRVIAWELRPGGMLVQKREDINVNEEESSSGHVMINISVSHASYHHRLTIPSHYTFGDLKRVLARETGLEPREQRVLFRGKEKEDKECLEMVGVKDSSKIVLLEDPASRERKLEAIQKNRGLSKAYDSVSKVRAEVDSLSQKVAALETTMHGDDGVARVADKDLVFVTELLMTQLLKLDLIEADGEAKAHRRIEVRRVQGLVDVLDSLRARKSIIGSSPFGRAREAVSMTTKWETFESGLGSLYAPKLPAKSSTRITHQWELFE